MENKASSVCLSCSLFMKADEKEEHEKTPLHSNTASVYPHSSNFPKEKSLICELSRPISVEFHCAICGQEFFSHASASQHLAFHELTDSNSEADKEWNHNLKVFCNFGFKNTDLNTFPIARSQTETQSVQQSIPQPLTNTDPPTNDQPQPQGTSPMKYVHVHSNLFVCGPDCRKRKIKRKKQAATPQGFYCETCKIACPGKESYDAHLVGKKHKKKVAPKQNPTQSYPSGYKSGVQKAKKIESNFYCKPCRMNLNTRENFIQHNAIHKNIQRAPTYSPITQNYGHPVSGPRGVPNVDFPTPPHLHPAKPDPNNYDPENANDYPYQYPEPYLRSWSYPYRDYAWK
ncbi:hypothetical protein RF11_08105 [Thelohanellus kitauei]|uniref:C2H2-type domain-containing protein n=1 Tax=Thelohanellus kitauei TaxID=669202 RepID=A0A0C2MRI9_THEKT|nr:hypothetical protein RF11_08105 [Thelohanellus kitauei]